MFERFNSEFYCGGLSEFDVRVELTACLNLMNLTMKCASVEIASVETLHCQNIPASINVPTLSANTIISATSNLLTLDSSLSKRKREDDPQNVDLDCIRHCVDALAPWIWYLFRYIDP